MFSPFLNGLRSTIDGMPWLFSMSSAQWASPLRMLPPPVSKKRFSAVGLVSKKLVGAMASRSKLAAKRIRSASTPSRPRLSMKASSSDPRARYACIVVRNRGLSRQAGSAKRLSPFCGAASDLPSPICRNCRPTLGQLCSNARGCRTATWPRNRSAPATWPRPEPASRPGPRTASAPSAPPASCAAVSARFSRGSAACRRAAARLRLRRLARARAPARSAAFGRRLLAAGLACWRPLGPVSVSGASPRGVVMVLPPRSSRCPVQLRRRGRRRRLIVDTTSRLPPVWRARKSFSSYFPRRCWWTGKARVGSRATAVTIARERAVFHDAIGYPSGAPGRAKNRRTVR